MIKISLRFGLESPIAKNIFGLGGGFAPNWWQAITLANSDPSAWWINTLRPRQNGRLFADDVFKCIFLNENVWISLKISLKFLPKVPINNIPALVQILAWRRSGNKPLSEPMMVSSRYQMCLKNTFVELIPHIPGTNECLVIELLYGGQQCAATHPEVLPKHSGLVCKMEQSKSISRTLFMIFWWLNAKET